MTKEEMKNKIRSALRQVFDPEIPINVYDLGMIYSVHIKDNFDVKVVMTLTSPNCPEAEVIPVDVKNSIKCIEGVGEVEVEITFDPPWTKEMMSDDAMLELGLL